MPWHKAGDSDLDLQTRADELLGRVANPRGVQGPDDTRKRASQDHDQPVPGEVDTKGGARARLNRRVHERRQAPRRRGR